MERLPRRGVMISVCLAGALLLLPLCWGIEDDQYIFDYDSSPSPEYDYNSTIEYTFFSNASSEELEKFLDRGPITDEKMSFTERTDDEGVFLGEPTKPSVIIENQASQSTPARFLLSLVLTAHQLLRLL